MSNSILVVNANGKKFKAITTLISGNSELCALLAIHEDSITVRDSSGEREIAVSAIDCLFIHPDCIHPSIGEPRYSIVTDYFEGKGLETSLTAMIKMPESVREGIAKAGSLRQYLVEKLTPDIGLDNAQRTAAVVTERFIEDV